MTIVVRVGIIKQLLCSDDIQFKADGSWEPQELPDAASKNVYPLSGNHSKMGDIVGDCERLWVVITRELP